MAKSPSNPPVPHDYVAIPGSERRPSKTSRLIGPTDPNEVFAVTIMMRRRPDGPPLPDFDYFLSTPPAQRQRMPEEEFAAKHGASQEDTDKVVAFAQSHGLTIVETNAARRMVIVRGTVAQMSDAFVVELARYEHEVELGRQRRRQTETYRGRDGVVSVPSSLAGIVVGVFGLDNRRIGKTNGAEPPNTNPLWVPAVSKLYKYPTNSAAGQTIGIFSLSGYASSDITGYFTNLNAQYPGYTAPTITDILINGATNPGFDEFDDGETTQDIDIASSFAPGCAINVYITTPDQAGWVQAISRVAHPEAGDSAPSVLSSSWYIADTDDPDLLPKLRFPRSLAFLQAVSAAFHDAAIQGVTVCIASGDRGTDNNFADGKCYVQYPASDPWVLSVGGTTIGNISGSSFDEYVWNDQDEDNWGTTGGGVSALFPLPSYQSGAGVPVSLNPPHNSGRGVPDVAGNASRASGYLGIVLGAVPGLGVGTSASAPQWAGLIAVINAALGVNVGFVNPVLYALGSSYFRDIVPGAGPSDNSNRDSPGYPAGPGWDACTGWGSPNGQPLLAGLKSVYARNLYFIVDKSTFGVDEVSDVIAQGGGLYSKAFWLVLEGFSIHELGDLQPALSGPFSTMAGGTVFMDAAGPVFEHPTDLDLPQRVRFPYDIVFTSTSLTTDFPSAGSAPNVKELDAKITLSGSILSAAALFQFVAGADPYFVNINPQQNNPFYLSQDLRVFRATPRKNPIPVPGGPAFSSDSPAGAFSYLQKLLAWLNGNFSDPTGVDPFSSKLPGQGDAFEASSRVVPFTIDYPYFFKNGQYRLGKPKVYSNYDFAIARVRLRGSSGSANEAKNVRVFFRLWSAQSPDTDYQPFSTYRFTPDSAGLPASPLVGRDHFNLPSTLPFFASGNLGANTDYGAGGANTLDIEIPVGRDSTWAYFGCFLNLYDAGNVIDGTQVQGWLSWGTTYSLVAQIATDDARIPAGVSPETSDKLAQRNLQVTTTDNPGWANITPGSLPVSPPGSEKPVVIPTAFDIRPSAAASPATDVDELMIDWGDVPKGTIASVYWPQVPAADVLAGC